MPRQRNSGKDGFSSAPRLPAPDAYPTDSRALFSDADENSRGVVAPLIAGKLHAIRIGYPLDMPQLLQQHPQPIGLRPGDQRFTGAGPVVVDQIGEAVGAQ